MPQGEFDGVPFGPWPQDHVGVALWSVGIVTSVWRDTAELLPICSIPFEPFPEIPDGYPEFAFFARILRPAIWLGLLEYEERKEPGEHWPIRKKVVRKTALFDEVLRFSVEIESHSDVLH